MSRSHSTTSVSGSTMTLGLRLVFHDGRELGDAEELGLAAENGRLEILRPGAVHSLERLDGAPRRRADRELEALHLSVPELHRPHDGVRGPQRRQAGAERHYVAVAAHGDGALRARL